MNCHNAELLLQAVQLCGIDTVAHLNSYDQLGKTIAVLGNGFNHIFPEENIGLYQKILDNDGLIVSEYSPDTKCQSQYFLERNRIVSGLSLGILVIEAVHRSGTSVTAKLAISQNRKVFTLPHEIWTSHGTGTNRLLKSGAILVTETDDILQELKPLKKFRKKLKSIERLNLEGLDANCEIFSNCAPHVTYNNLDSLVKNFANNLDVKNKDNDSLNILKRKKLKNPSFKYIYDLISTEPISINEICKITSKSVSEISNVLFSLELDGYIKKVAGGYICILNN